MRDNVTVERSQRVFCLLFSLVLPISFLWSAYSFFNNVITGIEPKTIHELDLLTLLGLIVCLVFFFGYAHYILSKIPFLQKAFIYMGWWCLLLVGKELLMLIPNKMMQVLLISFIHLLGLCLVGLAFINLRKLLVRNLGNPQEEETGSNK